MKLLVDIGNSRIKWALFDGEHLSSNDAFPRTKTGMKTAFKKHWNTLSDIEALYVSNVAGDKIAEQLADWSEKKWQLTPTFVQSEAENFGVRNGYDKPEQLGVDRWLTLIAAHQLNPKSISCIIDCGTAITIDLIDNGQHQGGLILPGLQLMQSSLISNTEGIEPTKPDPSTLQRLPTNTLHAVQAGAFYTITASLNQLVDDLDADSDTEIHYLITGGDAEKLLPLLPDYMEYFPHLVLGGLIVSLK